MHDVGMIQKIFRKRSVWALFCSATFSDVHAAGAVSFSDETEVYKTELRTMVKTFTPSSIIERIKEDLANIEELLQET